MNLLFRGLSALFTIWERSSTYFININLTPVCSILVGPRSRSPALVLVGTSNTEHQLPVCRFQHGRQATNGQSVRQSTDISRNFLRVMFCEAKTRRQLRMSVSHERSLESVRCAHTTVHNQQQRRRHEKHYQAQSDGYIRVSQPCKAAHGNGATAAARHGTSSKTAPGTARAAARRGPSSSTARSEQQHGVVRAAARLVAVLGIW